jgi:hypothetical protein
LEGEDNDGLPPRPQGCNGACQPADQHDMDADPCPHCTAKQFRDEMRDNNDEEDLKDLTPDEIGDMFQDFLKDWAEEQDEKKKEQRSEQKPEEIDDEPPEDEMQDAPEDQEGEKNVEHEEESKEFRRMAKDMTVTQEKRFDNLVERLEKKVEQMFGQTAEDIWVAAKAEGQFQGEEVSQSIQVTSRGVTYWVTISAAKEV